MDKKDIADRHWQLYEEQNKKLKRTVAAALVFGLVVLFNVITPFNDIYVERAHISQQMDSLKTGVAKIETTLQELQKLTNVMADVEKIIERRPWDAKRFELIEEYRRLNASGGGEPALYQSMADSAIKSIAAEVTARVYKPLAGYLQQDSLAKTLMPQTVQQLHELPQVVDEWINENLGRPWYSTLHSKAATINALSETLDRRLDLLSRALRLEQQEVVAFRKELKLKIRELQKQSVKAYEKRLQQLQQQLGEVLPSWANGLVSVQQVAILFPYIIFALLLYVLGLGRSLSQHFLAATAPWQDDKLRQDPLFSSNWTLVNRTTRGDVQSVGSYLLFAAVMFYFFENGAKLVAECLAADPALAPAVLFATATLWILRAIMAAALLALLWSAFSRQRHQEQ